MVRVGASRGKMKVVSAVPADLHQSWAPSHHSGRKCIPYQTTGGPWKPKGNKGGTDSIAQPRTQTLSNCILYNMLDWELPIGQSRSRSSCWKLPVGSEGLCFGYIIIISNKSPIIKEAESPREGITVNRCGPEGQ